MTRAVHGCTVYRGGGVSWASCSCGWVSDMFRNALDASAAWADHVADHEHDGDDR